MDRRDDRRILRSSSGASLTERLPDPAARADFGGPVPRSGAPRGRELRRRGAGAPELVDWPSSRPPSELEARSRKARRDERQRTARARLARRRSAIQGSKRSSASARASCRVSHRFRPRTTCRLFVPEDPVQSAVGKLDVPVIAVDSLFRPPPFLQAPRPRRHPDFALDAARSLGLVPVKPHPASRPLRSPSQVQGADSLRETGGLHV
jgi:hypothetical protein